ncbi:O-linked N-acetylglucosamine transferase family protein [Aquipseudomonas ullengensis]|uniref:protein O-GlcNAc transferase n=1 Tax=Aquipseudomonas ullengensis TaxID=2759166 RepID=A0A7W4LMH4_9GAMM|nr:tetratricopeptide repeat protein [Pseudomonas ullengensis]MBB2495878.1 tetratricopeptide repeat protein [Pseudomonas ullengensis]
MTVDTEWLVDFFRRQARLGFEEGDYTRTRNSCREVLQYVPADVESRLLLGEAALASRDSVAAQRAFDQLLELEPDNAEHAMKLGQACLQTQDWPAAAAAFNQVLLLQPLHQGAHEALALLTQLQERLNILDQLPAAQPGRNDPCPCGSGLKYKKCCLEKSSQHLMAQHLEQAFAAEQWEQVVSQADELQGFSPSIRRALALARYQLSQRELAYPLVQAACREGPDDLELRAALADLELDHRVALAQTLAESVLAADAGQWRASLVLAAVHARQGHPERSESTLREVLRHNPDCSLVWQRLSHFLRKSQRLEDDLAAMQEWTERCPQHADAWCHRGMSSIMTARIADGREFLERALQLEPEHFEALCWLGQSYQSEQDPHTALHYLSRGLQVKPDYQPGWNMLGGVYQSVGRQHESEGCFMRALAISPTQPLAWNNLANIYLDGHLLGEAERVMQVALELNPNSPSLWNNLGNILSSAKRLKEALAAFRKCAELDPGYEPVLVNLAGVESHFGNLDRSIELLRGAIEVPGATTNLLFFANYHADWSGEQVFSLYEEVTRRYPVRQYFQYENERTCNRRLRIGYVSPDFRNHVCAMFIEPLLSRHDHQQFEIFAYSLVRREDTVTERFIGHADHWRHCVGLSDEAIAEQIRADGIDVLVDLAGHTGSSRLQVFALKPAPVQVSWWMGFAFGTGLEQMDYFLADEQMLPPGCESSFAETLWRMPAPAVAYLPPQSMDVEIGELPALRNGYVTFGSLTRPVRLNHKVIRVWSELLLRAPNSRLMLDSSSFSDESLQQHYHDLFAEQGIDPERIVLGFTSPATSALAKMDIALDCFPHNSGTTLYESLYMGLPVVSLRDRPSMGRVGALILNGMGRDEWIADTEQQYLDKLVALASDVPTLAKIRAGLREEMLASKLCDAADFTRRMEQTYQQMWQHYCEQGEQQ